MTNYRQKLGRIAAIIGGQWGDEGKGKLVDLASPEYDIIARATGGANAGHTVYVGDEKYIFHLLPSGALHEKCTCVIGNGVVVHLPTLLEEIDVLKKAGIKTEGRFLISDRAHLLFEYHKELDGQQEKSKGEKKVGTTKRGIGPCYADKISRVGIRAGDFLDQNVFEKKLRAKGHDVEDEIEYYRENRARIEEMITDTFVYLHEALEGGKSILFEGANGVMLDIDHGTYPFVTSSNPMVGGLGTGTGVPGKHLDNLVGIIKAYTTRVGAGPFPTELDDEVGVHFRKQGGEYGSTTGRPRRCGWFDAVQCKYSARMNGYDGINLTKLDVLTGLEVLKIGVSYSFDGKVYDSFPASIEALEDCEVEYIEMPGWKEEISGVREFDELPQTAKDYVRKVEELMGVPVWFIGVGPKREQMLMV
ncbi:MAG: adenylosuccinate synthase [Patescibacteria group bacterium]|nr:adenylosuccinate synthase [Patescibacteria group bacterium]